MQNKLKTYFIHSLLFILTFITTTLAGEFWIHGKTWYVGSYSWEDFSHGLAYSIPFLGILTVHEFGHYFTAKYHKVKTTLPYYIPLPPSIFLIGTMGALIRIKEVIKSKKQHFDIGVSGPIAGFIIALGVLFYGFTHLPPKEYIFEIHPEYEQFGENYADHVYTYEFHKEELRKVYQKKLTADSIKWVEDGSKGEWSYDAFEAPAEFPVIAIGGSILFEWFKSLPEDASSVPNIYELVHYPWLFAGFLALFFTSINLLPIGQLDGGHVLYGLLGTARHKKVAAVVYLGFLFYAGLGLLTPYDSSETIIFNLPLPVAMAIYIYFLYSVLGSIYKDQFKRLIVALLIFIPQFTLPMLNPEITGYEGWLVFAFIIGRFIGVYHPPAPIEEPLDIKRKIIGWIALLIFILSFSPTPIYFDSITL